MRKILGVLLVFGCLGTAYAELQNVQVGGEVRIRGRWWRHAWASVPVNPVPAFAVQGRPVGPFGMTSLYDWDDRQHDLTFVEQRTALTVHADFTDEVAAFIEMDSYERWGQDFRSNYLTGVDGPANSVDDVEAFQAYIEANELGGRPVRLRIGRQELKMGKGWLVTNRITPTLGQSFDAVLVTYDADRLTLDAWCSKLAENSPVEEDGDVDFYGIYSTYKGFEPVSLSAYWMWVRDARDLGSDTTFGVFGEWVEDVLGVDDYDVTNLHVFGVRAWGGHGAWDYDLELAYEAGEADAVGIGFKSAVYGDDRADFDAWAGDIETGYTFDFTCRPRVYIGGAYFEGEDNRDLDLREWLAAGINPFHKPEASVSFNRLFSGFTYSAILDILGGVQSLSNFYQVRAGLTGKFNEKLTTGLQVAYFGVDEAFDLPRHIELGRCRVPPTFAPQRVRIWLPPAFWTQEADDDIGWVTHVWLKYDYSDDWFVKVGWEHLFTGDALDDGNFLLNNALRFNGGTDDDDADYIYFDTGIKF